LTKDVDDPRPNPGQRITYTVVVENSGMLSATDTLISDTLPNDLTFTRPIILDPPGAGSVGTYPTLVHSLTIAPGTSVSVTFPVTVNIATAVCVITNTAVVRHMALTETASVTIIVSMCFPFRLYLPLLLKTA
jgi:uncharacterized repeat protein (TIGR01451 family)